METSGASNWSQMAFQVICSVDCAMESQIQVLMDFCRSTRYGIVNKPRVCKIILDWSYAAWHRLPRQPVYPQISYSSTALQNLMKPGVLNTDSD